ADLKRSMGKYLCSVVAVRLALTLAARTLWSQGANTPVPCNGEVVTDVVIRSRAPTYGGIFARSLLRGHLWTSMHVATEPSVIRNFVLLHRGDQCTIKLRRETERVLRAQPFIADAEVTAYPDGPGHVSFVVSTIDEPQVVASLGIRNTTPYVNAVTFGNTNVGGGGVYAGGGWREGYFYRDTSWFGYSDYQLFRRPDQWQLRAARNEHGYGVT